MQICKYHDGEVVYEDINCPACEEAEKVEKLEAEIEGLESDNDKKDAEICKLEKLVEELKNK